MKRLTIPGDSGDGYFYILYKIKKRKKIYIYSIWKTFYCHRHRHQLQ